MVSCFFTHKHSLDNIRLSGAHQCNATMNYRCQFKPPRRQVALILHTQWVKGASHFGQERKEPLICTQGCAIVVSAASVVACSVFGIALSIEPGHLTALCNRWLLAHDPWGVKRLSPPQATLSPSSNSWGSLLIITPLHHLWTNPFVLILISDTVLQAAGPKISFWKATCPHMSIL